MENNVKPIWEREKELRKEVKNNTENIEILVDILKDADTVTIIELIDMFQNAKYPGAILEEVREKFAEVTECCPYCGHSDFSEHQVDNGMDGYYHQQWTELFCNNCKEQI